MKTFLNKTTKRLYFTVTKLEKQSLTIPNVGETMEQPKVSSTADKNVKQCNHCE